MNEIRLAYIDLYPRKKPDYHQAYDESEIVPSPIPDILSINFREGVSYELQSAVESRTDENTYVKPDENICFMVDLSTSRDLDLLGVVKNLMDASTRVLYSDDSKIRCVMARKHIDTDRSSDLIRVRVASNLDGNPWDMNSEDLQALSIFNHDFEAFACDSFLAYPRSIELVDSGLENEEFDVIVQDQLDEYDIARRHTQVTKVRLLLPDAHIHHCDIDNLALSIMVNLQTINFLDYQDIVSLDLKRISHFGHHIVIQYE